MDQQIKPSVAGIDEGLVNTPRDMMAVTRTLRSGIILRTCPRSYRGILSAALQAKIGELTVANGTGNIRDAGGITVSPLACPKAQTVDRQVRRSMVERDRADLSTAPTRSPSRRRLRLHLPVKGCAELTDIPLARGFLYLVAIMDWWSRKVLAWRWSHTMEAAFCVDALEEAMDRPGKPEIFNTVQGSQFTSWELTQKLKGAGIRISMDGKGRGQTPDAVYHQTNTVTPAEMAA